MSKAPYVEKEVNTKKERDGERERPGWKLKSF